MVRRLSFVLVACAACATVADLEVNRADAGSGSADRNDVDEAGATPPAEAGAGDGTDTSTTSPDAGPPTAACGCDAGAACCIRSSAAPACDVPSCTDPGSLVVGCVRASTDGRDCCWNADGGVARSTFGAGCASSTAACVTDDDCAGQGGKCTTLACKGVALGVCAPSPPSWFTCPP